MKNMSVRFPIVVIIALLITGSSCENNFNPIAENNKYRYSLYGILDTSADTQWVRVMPIRKSILREAIPNDATVTLIKESTGERLVMEDSLFELRQNTYAWNFWTTTEILPEHTYSVEAESPDGETTSATTTIPEDFPTPEIEDRGTTCTVRFHPDLEHLVVAGVRYKFKFLNPYTGLISDFQFYSISYLDEIQEFSDRDQFTFNPYPALATEYEVPIENILELSGEVTIVSADSVWYGKDNEEAELPGVMSNVINGLGLFTGIVSKKLPLRPNVEGQEHLLACPSIIERPEEN